MHPELEFAIRFVALLCVAKQEALTDPLHDHNLRHYVLHCREPVLPFIYKQPNKPFYDFKRKRKRK